MEDSINRFLAYPLEELPFVALVLLIAFAVHEFAHAYTAYKFGDPTAYKEGRVTLNPRAHLDVLGTIFILIAGFGWAKPVPVNPSYFRRRKLMSFIVTFAGPLSNLLLMAAGIVIWHVLAFSGALDGASSGMVKAIDVFFIHFTRLNAILFIFNLIPLPPLDGYRILENFAPRSWKPRMHNNEQWGVFALLLLVFLPPLSNHILRPIMMWAYDLIYYTSKLTEAVL